MKIMGQFLTLIHSGGGSLVEGANAELVLGPWPSHAKADEVGDIVLATLAPINQYYRDEFFHTVVEIPDQQTDVRDSIQALLDDRGEGVTLGKLRTRADEQAEARAHLEALIAQRKKV